MRLASMSFVTAVRYERASHVSPGTQCCNPFFLLPPQPDNATMDFWRARLNVTLLNITSEYNALMHGGKAVTQIGQKFQEPSPAASYLSTAFSDMFYKSDICFRFNQSTCYDANSTWYHSTRNGLNSMMIRCLEELSHLVQDDNSVVNYTNPQFQAWYYIGVTDLYDGLQTAAEVFINYSNQKYKTVMTAQLVLMVSSVFLAALYLLFILRPYLALQKDEVVKVAGLVSHCPREVDVRGHAKKIMRMVGTPQQQLLGNRVQPVTSATDAAAVSSDDDGGKGEEDHNAEGGGSGGSGQLQQQQQEEDEEPVKGFGRLKFNVNKL